MACKIAHSLSEKERTRDVETESSISFSNLLLSEEVLRGLADCGFQKPSPIQHKALPLGRCGFDLIIKAKSGTGKTVVFAVTALEMVKTDINSVQVLILTPTREIAVQIESVIVSLGKHIKDLKVSSFIGGMPIEDDKVNIKNCHIAIGAPGRIKHLIDGKVLQTENVRLFILDEADKLMESNLKKTVTDIYKSLPQRKQMITSSATYSEHLEQLIKKYMNSPLYICPESDSPVLLGLMQYVCIVKSHLNNMQQMKIKNSELLQILSKVSFTQCLVFSNYQSRAESISNIIKQKGWSSIYISGAQTQPERLDAFKKLKEFKCRVILTTDVSARGIDVSNIDLVINYDIPNDTPTYLHRMGRAGRYGSRGICISLAADGKELQKFRNILGEIGGTELSIPKIQIDDNFHDNIWEMDLSKLERIFGCIDGVEAGKTSVEDMRNIVYHLNESKTQEIEEDAVTSKMENLSFEGNQSSNSPLIGILEEPSENVVKDMLLGIKSQEDEVKIKYKDTDINELLQNIASSSGAKETSFHDNETNLEERGCLKNKKRDEINLELTDNKESKNADISKLLQNLAAGQNIKDKFTTHKKEDKMHADSLKSKIKDEANLEISDDEMKIKEAINLSEIRDINPKKQNINEQLNELIKGMAMGNISETDITLKYEKGQNDVLIRNLALLNVAKLLKEDLQNENIPESTLKPLDNYVSILKSTNQKLSEYTKNTHDQIDNNYIDSFAKEKFEEYTVQDAFVQENNNLASNVQVQNDCLKYIFKHAYDNFINPKSLHWSNYIKKEDNGNFKLESNHGDIEFSVNDSKRDKRKSKLRKDKDSKNQKTKRTKHCEDYAETETEVESSHKQEVQDKEIFQYETSYSDNQQQFTFSNQNCKIYNSIDEEAVSYFDYYNNVLWNDALTFEDVPSFDNWFLHWKSQVQSVRNYIQQRIYIEEMNKYQHRY